MKNKKSGNTLILLVFIMLIATLCLFISQYSFVELLMGIIGILSFIFGGSIMAVGLSADDNECVIAGAWCIIVAFLCWTVAWYIALPILLISIWVLSKL